MFKSRDPYSRAGVQTREQYKDRLRDFQAKPALRNTVVGLSIVVALLMAVAIWTTHGFSIEWVFGLVTGSVLTFAIWVISYAPPHIENWEIGALHEARTADELSKLRAHGWLSLHDLEDEWGNIDHVAIGPGGIFLIDTKFRNGNVTVDADIVRIDHRRDEKMTNAIRGQSFRFQQRLKVAGLPVNWVQPVVVLWGEFEQRQVDTNKVFCIHGNEIEGWFRARPKRLTDEQIAMAFTFTKTMAMQQAERRAAS